MLTSLLAWTISRCLPGGTVTVQEPRVSPSLGLGNVTRPSCTGRPSSSSRSAMTRFAPELVATAQTFRVSLLNASLAAEGVVMATLGGKTTATSVGRLVCPRAASASARAFSRLRNWSSRLITSGR